MPKPMVPIAGVPLIESVIRNFRAAGIAPLAVIVNEQERACVDWVKARFPDLDVEFIVKTDRKSTRLNSSHLVISYAVFCLKKKKTYTCTTKTGNRSRH